MKLQEATQIANELVEKLRPLCDKAEIAGSVRRRRPEVHDIDIVAIPNEDKLISAGYFGREHLVSALAHYQVTQNGPKIASFQYLSSKVDIYWATEENWNTLLLIRTGSKQHNIKLATLARSKGWTLHASGLGLYDSYNRRIAGDTEEGIFKALGMPFIPPEEREE